jgi:hypothetical protein
MKRDLNEIMTEKEVIDLTGLTKGALSNLRNNKMLPFCPITSRVRIYMVADIIEYIASRRRVINKDA